jgi:serine O-acetyltransferase
MHQGVTIGAIGSGGGFPEIGNCVYFGAGSKILGAVKIGNDVVIGANAVVTRDVPDNAVAGGIPAKIINYKSSQKFVHYREK